LLHSGFATLIQLGEINDFFPDDSEEIGEKDFLDWPSFEWFPYKTAQKLGAGHAKNPRSPSKTTGRNVETAPYAHAKICVDSLPVAADPLFLLWGSHGHEQQIRSAGIYLLDNRA
jgi:hypothetical protein